MTIGRKSPAGAAPITPVLRRLVGELDVPVAAVWLDKITAPDLPHPFSWLATIATNVQQSGVSINGVSPIACRARPDCDRMTCRPGAARAASTTS